MAFSTHPGLVAEAALSWNGQSRHTCLRNDFCWLCGRTCLFVTKDPQGQTRAGGPPLPETLAQTPEASLVADASRRGRAGPPAEGRDALGGLDVQLGGGFQSECGLQPDLKTYHNTV